MNETFRTSFVEHAGFALDDFQIEALDAIDAQRDVLVSAPTGSGKTLVAQYAVGAALARGERAFYTTPLKALSNQKFHELCSYYGSDNVGLLTGDTSIHRDARVVVMTTEVLRNMLLNNSEHVRHLGVVVLDEVHFLQDPYRGGVWEEVLILTAPEVHFVSLSATIGNAGFLGGWLSEVRGPTTIISETNRPIALSHHLAFHRRGHDHVEVAPLLDGVRLSDSVRRLDNLMRSTRRFRTNSKHHGPHGQPPSAVLAPRRSDLLRALEREDLLPVIVFIFSRAACDDAVRQCRHDGVSFTNAAQRQRILEIGDSRVDEFTSEDLAALNYSEFLDALSHGIAMHHAGMVPAFREIVEKCFEEGLLSAVYATETLALGINMPARSVAIERFTKYSDAGRQRLTSTEFAQLTGRAGRRGLDEQGHAVVCYTTDLNVVEVGRVALAEPAELRSSFHPTYNLTTNLIASFDRDTAFNIVRRSFAQYETDRRPHLGRVVLTDRLEARRQVLEELGYVEEWRLTARGELLRQLYHESDLYIAEAILSGALESLEPAQLAGVISAFVFEAKRRQRGRHDAPQPSARRSRQSDRLGASRRSEMSTRLRDIDLAVATVRTIEGRHRLPTGREPDGQFGVVIAAWARGANLGATLDLADSEVGLTSAGDFVRHAKQVADLLEQISRLRVLGDLALRAGEAQSAVLRSVVLGASTVHPSQNFDI